MSAYTKALLGWVDVEEITEDGMRALPSSSKSNKVYMISKGFPINEYLLIEHHDADSYDKGMHQPGIASTTLIQMQTAKPAIRMMVSTFRTIIKWLLFKQMAASIWRQEKRG